MSKIKGLHTHRFRDNPEEKRFAEAWAKHVKSRHDIDGLLDAEHGTMTPEPASDRDRIVAATVIQWLGSPVGQGFLRDLGYERTKK